MRFQRISRKRAFNIRWVVRLASGGTVALSAIAAEGEDQPQKLAQEELGRLNSASGLHSTINFTDSEAIQADPNGTIYFPQEAVKEIQDRTKAIETREVIRFMLAHEQTHEVQFKRYGVEAVRPSDPTSDRARQISRIRECQADILGAKYLMENLNEIDEQNSESQLMVSETLREVLKVAFSLGVKEKDAYYPPPSQRLTAARLGLSRGILEKIKRHVSDDPRFAGSQRQLEIVLDVQSGQDILAWSLRLAKRIVHYDDAVLKALSLSDEETSNFDQSAASGSVQFRLRYKNSGSTAISVDMEVQCVTAAEENPDDTFSWEKWSVRNFLFGLQPGQEYVAKGELYWSQGGNGKIARLIVPVKDDNALLSVEPTH